MSNEDFKYGGYAGKILRVNLTLGEVTKEPLDEEMARKYLGENGFAAKILYDELEAGIDPLSEENKLLLMTGPTVGTGIATAARTCLATKSPETDLFLDSYAGGFWGPEIKYAGFDGIIVEGKSEKPVYINIEDGEVEIKDAEHLWGKDTVEAQRILKEEEGECQIACIGPAGEKLSRIACTILGIRACGRGGSGAVWGSKNLKAISVKGSGGLKVPDQEKFEEFTEKLLEAVYDNPATAEVLPEYGTPAVVGPQNEVGVLGTRNWQKETFEDADELMGQKMTDTMLVKAKACFACPIRCTRYNYVSEGDYEGTLAEGPEYETIFALGSMCSNSSLESIAKADILCDMYGLDTIAAGGVIAYAMESFEKGVLTEEDTDGLDLSFGNDKALVEMVRKIGEREGLGDILAEGVKRAAEEINVGSEAWAIHSKGMEVAGHTARGMYGHSLGYMAGTRGGSHHDSRPTLERKGQVDRKSVEGKGEFSAKINDMMTFNDCIGVCDMLEGVLGAEKVTEFHKECVNAVTGMDLSLEEAREIADRVYTLERCFNVREGIRRKHDILPYRFMHEPIPEGPSEGMKISPEIRRELLNQYYEYRGWDEETGIPKKEKLEELDLGELERNFGKIGSGN